VVPGRNIPGKPRVFMPYIGGNAYYQTEIDKVAQNGYEGFHLSGSDHAAARARLLSRGEHGFFTRAG
jgi:hypothetical protein